LDARRCISYLTIEHKGPIPREFRALMGNRIYGCDDCLAVCPLNKFAQAGHEAKLAAREALRAPSLDELVTLNDAQFRAVCPASIKRTGRDRFIRNVLIAIGNSGRSLPRAACRAVLGDQSALVRGAVCGRSGGDARAAGGARKCPDREADSFVREEWAASLSDAAA
jgi:epoxyqueuosine reductase